MAVVLGGGLGGRFRQDVGGTGVPGFWSWRTLRVRGVFEQLGLVEGWVADWRMGGVAVRLSNYTAADRIVWMQQTLHLFPRDDPIHQAIKTVVNVPTLILCRLF